MTDTAKLREALDANRVATEEVRAEMRAWRESGVAAEPASCFAARCAAEAAYKAMTVAAVGAFPATLDELDALRKVAEACAALDVQRDAHKWVHEITSHGTHWRARWGPMQSGDHRTIAEAIAALADASKVRS